MFCFLTRCYCHVVCALNSPKIKIIKQLLKRTIWTMSEKITLLNHQSSLPFDIEDFNTSEKMLLLLFLLQENGSVRFKL